MEDSKTVFCSSKFPWARERISSKFVDNLGFALKKFRQPCSEMLEDISDSSQSSRLRPFTPSRPHVNLFMNLVFVPWTTLRLHYTEQLINAIGIITVHSENYEKAINADRRQDAECRCFEAHDKAYL
jgi:hypothetical protein